MHEKVEGSERETEIKKASAILSDLYVMTRPRWCGVVALEAAAALSNALFRQNSRRKRLLNLFFSVWTFENKNKIKFFKKFAATSASRQRCWSASTSR